MGEALRETHSNIHRMLSDTPRVFKDTMMQVADHLHGLGGVEEGISALPSSISDAMLSVMENKETVKNKVSAHWMQPRG